MSEGFKIYQTGNFIKKIEKDLNKDSFKKTIQELAAASTLYHDHNLPIDIKEIDPLTHFSDVINLLLETTKFYHAFRNKIAIIIADEPDRIARAKFFKSGLKPGNYQFAYFTDYEKAIDWLSDIQECPPENTNKH